MKAIRRIPAGKVYDQPVVPLNFMPTIIAATDGNTELRRRLSAKGRTVICFQDQRLAVLGEEPLQGTHGFIRSHVHGGVPQELLMTGEIAHGQEVRVLTIDKARRLGEVHGPGGAGDLPVKDAWRV